MLVLCVVVPGVVLAATGNTNMGIVWTELGLFASPVAFFVGGEHWGASLWLCGVAALYVIGSALLCLALVIFEASVSRAIALGLLVALLAGAVALAGCIVSRGSLPVLVGWSRSRWPGSPPRSPCSPPTRGVSTTSWAGPPARSRTAT